MLQINTPEEGLSLFKALGSDVRVAIVRLLQSHPGMNMKDMAQKLGITGGALTSHVKQLEKCGLIKVTQEAASHGNQKVASLAVDKILINLEKKVRMDNEMTSDIWVGHYANYRVFPTCGLASARQLLGQVDDTRFFSHPDRYEADILWLAKGYVEYVIPNFIPSNQRIVGLVVSAELSSEAPGVNENWPSDISFYINGKKIGCWTSPGDFGDKRGVFTPEWWYPRWNQYGLFKVIEINEKGTYVDGMQVSSVSMREFQFDSTSEIRFRFSVDEDAEHVGGLTIFGKSFGNYAQDIRVTIRYEEMGEE